MASTVPQFGDGGGTEQEAIYDALLARSGQYSGQISAGRDKLVSQVIPAAQRQFGTQRIMHALNPNSNYMKAVYSALSALSGTPYYDRTGEGNTGKLFFVEGFRPQGAAPEMSLMDPAYWNFDPQGRNLGFRSGYINNAYIT